MGKEKEVADFLIGYIRERKFKPGDRIPSEYELAELCSVNKTTANKAVATLVAAGWFERRRGAAGTVVARDPNLFRGVIAFRTKLINGLTFSALIVRGAEMCAAEHGYTLQYHEHGAMPEQAQLELIAASGAVGLLDGMGLTVPEGFPLPTLSVGHVGTVAGNYVHSDRAAGVRELAGEVFRKGHRQVVLTIEAYDRFFYTPVMEVFESRGVAFPERRCFVVGSYLEFDPALLYPEIRRLFPGTTAIMCDSDNDAFNLICHLERNGIRVPEDVSVTGYGNMNAYQRIRRIASADQFPEKMGYLGCKGLIDIVERRREALQLMMTPELVSGDTLAAL